MAFGGSLPQINLGVQGVTQGGHHEFNLFTDASGVGIGAVLYQNHIPIAFASRTLNKAERNYTVTERECLAVVWALNKFKTYFGSLPVKIITDHVAITKLTNGKNLSSRILRWALKLSEFNIEREHRPGIQNVVADVLSRNVVGNMDGSQIWCTALRALALNSREQLFREQREDPELGHIYRYLENPDNGSVNVTVCEDPSHQRDTRQGKPPTEGSRHEGSGQYVKARETRTTKSGTNRTAERRPVRSKQATAVRAYPYYLRRRVKEPEGIPEERRSIGIDSIPQNNIRRRSLSFSKLLGFEPGEIKGNVDSPYIADPNAAIPLIYVYCDVVEPQIVGDVQAPLLKIVKS
ncbi:retrovirus-related Pol polyprotein from transposon opus [Trichonephila clavipes]|nr:retrovirus-related Pol polyprotein from transposon opus [Trichonephila clavipes]